MERADLPNGAISLEQYNRVRNAGGRTVFDFSSFRQRMLGAQEPSEEEMRNYEYSRLAGAINRIIAGPAPPITAPTETLEDITAYHILSPAELAGTFMIDNESFDLDACVIDVYRNAPEEVYMAPVPMVDAFVVAWNECAKYLDSLRCNYFPGQEIYYQDDLIVPDGGGYGDGACISDVILDEFDGYDALYRHVNYRMILFQDSWKDRYVYQLSAFSDEVPTQVLRVGIVAEYGKSLRHFLVHESDELF